MEHPLIGDLSNLTLEELNTQISDLYRKLNIATQSGSYTVEVTDSNGCSSFSNPISVVITAIEKAEEAERVNVYRTPSDAGYWILECGSNLAGSQAEVTDINGRVVFKTEIKEPRTEIGFEGAKGIYLLSISSRNSNIVRKLVRW